MAMEQEKRLWKRTLWLLVLLGLLMSIGPVAQVSAGADQIFDFYFTSPGDGETVYGEVTVEVFMPFSNPSRPGQSVRWAIDKGAFQTMTASGNGYYTAKWNTAYFQNGRYDLTARYVDATGTVQSTSIQVLVCQRLQPCESP